MSVRQKSRANRKVHFAVVPAAGYTLQTGFAALLAGNALFELDSSANQSLVTSSIAYTQYHQIIFPILSDIWSKNNIYHLSTDWRYLKYPSETFGLGIHTDINEGYTLDYSAIKLHQTLLRKVGGNFYAGIGWDVDYFWNVTELDTPAGHTTSSFEKYGGEGTEFSTGPVLAGLYDTRDNPVNPTKGAMLKVDFHLHPTFLGNDDSWNSLIVDARKYFRFPANSNNILAFWNYDWFTKSGKAPYLMLPNTGGDPNSNTGRGYIQGRFRGNNFLYLEGEYRVPITRNGLLGA
ncbi:MAG: BamA/TamA family outer membrane protein, partial [Chitinophagaceae bacterium]